MKETLIEFKDGRWLVNGKRSQDMNIDERHFLDEFFKDYEINKELFKNATI